MARYSYFPWKNAFASEQEKKVAAPFKDTLNLNERTETSILKVPVRISQM
jgi:hypothetical protein